MSDAQLQAAVIDASLGIKLFVQEAGSEQVDRLFESLAADPPAVFFVPDLFYIECANILWKYVRRFGYPVDIARQNILDFRLLALQGIPTVELVTEALDLALALDLTAYDACYAALARRLDLPLLTADSALAKKLASAHLLAITLENLPL